MPKKTLVLEAKVLRQQEPKHLSFKSLNTGKPRTYVIPDGKNAGDGRTSFPDPRGNTYFLGWESKEGLIKVCIQTQACLLKRQPCA